MARQLIINRPSINIVIFGALFLLSYLSHSTGEDIDSLYDGSAQLSICDQVHGGAAFCSANTPIIRAVYCYNNGSGICKALAGRYEFYFDSFNDKFLRSAPKSKYVDEYGLHERVPVSYQLDGQPFYVDRSLNWANEFVKSNQSVNLLSIQDFNWCGYTENNLWPYKSSIIDYNSKGRYHIYFSNRQSCIFDNKTGKAQHFNTRFLHNSSLRIDLDMNPTIFAMEDRVAGGEIRLVKHKRQHWYEVKYRVVENPTPDLRYFVEMQSTETLPCRYNDSSGPLLSKDAYKHVTENCLDDRYQLHRTGKNAELLQSYCGLEETEAIDWMNIIGQNQLYRAGLHNIPRDGSISDSYFGLDLGFRNSSWEIFAKDGLAFSAFTSVPIERNKVRTIMLYATYTGNERNIYDEFYPMPYLADYTATFDGSTWRYNRNANAKQLKYLNYVDDIAYLDKCKSILTIFGPLYTEHPASKFNADTKAPLGSIVALGMWELVNAFTGQPGTNIIWAFHRTNFLAGYEYKCAKGSGSLVTADKKSSKYNYFRGQRAPAFEWASRPYEPASYSFSEEWFFKRLGVYKGSLDNPEAPDPNKYIDQYLKPAEPLKDEDSNWLYWVIAIATLLIVAMCVLCLLTLRRWRRRRMKERPTERSSSMSSGIMRPTVRTSMTSAKPSRVMPTVRSSFRGGRSTVSGATAATAATARSSRLSGKSRRSSFTKRSSSLSPSSKNKTRSTSGSSRSTSRSSQLSNKGKNTSSATSSGRK